MKRKNEMVTDNFPQDAEENEYRYLIPAWLDAIARGLTAGAVKHPGETWRQIPANEHAWRAVRHLTLWLGGDRSEPHLVNASMRCMMAFTVDLANDWLERGERRMSEELKPCPFCGSSEVTLEKTGFKHDPLYYVHCLECEATGTTNTKDYAIQLWNDVRRDRGDNND